MAKFLDTVIMLVIIAFGLFIFYKPLKEPIDKLFALIGKGISALSQKMAASGGAAKDSAQEIITYG